MNNKCEKCGHALKTGRENVRWDSLPSTVLVNVPVERCATCGGVGITFQSMDGLMELATRTVIGKSGRLAGAEVRFLRAMLDLDSAELAEAVGSNPATVSRWEHDKQPIGRHADLLLRAMVLLQMGGEPTLPSYFQQIGKDITPATLVGFECVDGAWRAVQIDSPSSKVTRATRALGRPKPTRARAQPVPAPRSKRAARGRG
jgi:DNA-binding transcriptional regulator YiaG